MQVSALVLSIPALSGCASEKLDLSLDYSDQVFVSESPYQGSVGVDEFVDLRPRAVTSDARKWLGFIPGVLWVKMDSEIPDSYTAFSDYSSGPLPLAYASAVRGGLERSRLFEKAVFLPRDRYVHVDYRLEGELNRTFLRETGYYYGSGLYAWLTRILGLPYVSYEIDVDILLRLRRLDNDEIVWTYEVKDSAVDKYYSVYELADGVKGKNVISYNMSEILRKNMSLALESMDKALARSGARKAEQ